MARRRFFFRLAGALSVSLLASYLASPWILPVLGSALVDNQAPQKADAILVLAGDSVGNRILKGAALVQQGYAPIVYVSGPSSFYGFTEDQLAIGFAVKHGQPVQWFAGLPNQAQSTLDEARMLLPILRSKGVKRLLLVTSNFHTARAARIFRRTALSAQPGAPMEIVIVAAGDASFTPQVWWNSRQGQKTFFFEASKTFADYVGL